MIRLVAEAGILLDPFDPRSWEPAPQPDAIAWLSLSSEKDCHCQLDEQDRAWAVGPDPLDPVLWCHTYGSGSFDNETWTIDRPDHIYARRSIKVPGKTASGRQRYGNLWLHRAILLIAAGPPPYPDMVGDHINGDTLDNRRCNLRWATRVENARNVKGSALRDRLVMEQAILAQLMSQQALPAAHASITS